MRDLVVSWGCPAGRVTVVPNPAPNPAEAGTFDIGSKPVVAFAGRLTAAKNLELLLSALVEVPGAHLVVAGDGEERGRLEELARELAVADRVRFVGAQPRSAVLGLLRDADVAVLSSAWENFPHGAVEALAMGTPVVATSVGGVPEIVHDEQNGLLVPSGDASALSAALRRVLQDAELRARLAAGAAPSVERFDLDELYGTIERILEEAVR